MNGVNLEVVTLEDLMVLNETKGVCVVVNDGKIVGFEK